MAEPAARIADDSSANVAVAEKTAALARTWQSIVEEESLFDVRIPGGAQIPAHLDLLVDEETVMNGRAATVDLPHDDPDSISFTSAYGNGRLIYGYPVLHYPDGSARPMFVLRGTLKNGRFEVERAPPRLNAGLLQEVGLTAAAQAELLDAVGKEKDFRARLTKVCTALQVEPKRFGAHALDERKSDRKGHMEWANRPILAVAAMPASLAAATRELTELASDAASDVSDKSALAGFEEAPVPVDKHGKREPLDAPLVFDIHNLGASQTQAVRAGMNHRLSVVECPPGTGQMAMLVNLVATAVMNGQSVLYCARRPETVAAMTKHLDAWVSRNAKVAVKVGRKAALKKVEADIRDGLAKMLKEDEAAAANAKSKTQREKPTLKSLQEMDRLPSSTDATLEQIRQGHQTVLLATAEERQIAMKLAEGWADGLARRAPTPTPSKLTDWRNRLDTTPENSGIGGMVKSLISKDGGRDGLISEIRAFIARMPAPVKAAAMECMGNGKDNDAVKDALNVLKTFGRWKVNVDRRNTAIRDLVRLRDGRAIELQALNQAARKVSASRELYRDALRDRLLSDVARLEKQAGTFFDLTGEHETVTDAQHRAHRSQRLAEALRILARTLPIWAATPTDLAGSIPFEAAIFDLVIIDEAEQLTLGQILPALYRGQRAFVTGSALNHTRTTPVGSDPARSNGLPKWASDPGRTALGALTGWLEEGGSAPIRLNEHFRSHPVIADFLSSTFYSHSLEIRSNYRKMRDGIDPGFLGLHWHTVDGSLQDEGHGLINEPEVLATESILKEWDGTGLFDLAPRKSVGIATPLPHQVEILRERIKRGKYSAGLRERVSVAEPEAFNGRQVDLLILLPGLAGDGPPATNAALAENRALFHDAVGAARLGVHIIGDRAACTAAGGAVAALSGFCVGGDDEETGDQEYNDDFERRLDLAFSGDDGAPLDPLPVLRQILDSLGYPYQEGVVDDGEMLTFRILAPLGGRYDIEISKPISQVRSERELLREAERDRRLAERGYHVLRLLPEEVVNKQDFLTERLQRLV